MNTEKYISLFGKTEDGTDFTELSGVPYFSVAQTFDCGQCFRFEVMSDGSTETAEGTAFGKYIKIEQKDGKIRLIGISADEYKSTFSSYLGLDEDYEEIREDIGKHFGAYGDTIFEAMECASGIRILRQDSWEALASFIISQNNNIPRIKKIIENMSRGIGTPFTGFDKKEHYAFPTAEQMISAGEAGLAPFKMGFRTRYLLDAAKRYLSGETDFDYITKADAPLAEAELMKICGVGKKVASCTLLFGFHKLGFFPIDVWIKRVLEKYYPDGIDLSSLGDYAGVAQQYLFYYERYINSGNKEKETAK
ncbi:MAG: DNA-3-methyladenine glycosylase family protein [Eubacteriales bacterium]